MAPVIGGLPGQKAETASQLIQQYVDWIISQTPLTAQQKPATAGFMLTQNNPASFGKEPTTSQPEVVYSQGVLAYSGFGTLWGYGTIQSNQNLFNVAPDMVYVSLETNGVLTVNGGPSWSLTLHHDVLVGSTFMPVESTSPGTVVTLTVGDPWHASRVKSSPRPESKGGISVGLAVAAQPDADKSRVSQG